MRCRECGLEVDNDKAFCPVCGAPMKVTADYDYIQAEIANKVDRYFNDDDADDLEEDDSGLNIIPFNDDEDADGSNSGSRSSGKESSGSDSGNEGSSSEEDEDADVKIAGKPKRRNTTARTEGNKRSARSRSRGTKDAAVEELAKTKNIKVSDSIFDEIAEDIDDGRESYPENRKRTRSSSGQRSKAAAGRQRSSRNPANMRNVQYRVVRKNQTAAKIATVLIIFVIIAAAAVGIMAVLGVFNDSNQTGTDAPAQNTASLTSNVAEGVTYSAPVQVVLNNAVEGNIFYTLDGSEPSLKSRIYQGAFDITAADVAATYPEVHLRAVSFSKNSEKSGELNVSFSLEYNEEDAKAAAAAQQESKEQAEARAQQEAEEQVVTVSAPVISPASGNYSVDTDILVTSAQGGTIYYTYDGSVPDETSERYTGSVKMLPGSGIFSAICVVDGVKSDVTSCSYTLDYGYNTSAAQAMTAVINDLLYNGYIIDTDGNTYNGYTGFTHEGVYTINGYTYYVIRVDFYSQDGTLTDTQYRGVGVNYGAVYYMGQEGGTFYLY